MSWYQQLQASKKNKEVVKLLIFQGSPRDKSTCPTQDGKTKDLIGDAISEFWSDSRVKIDIVDLSVKGDGKIIQPCKGCYSSSAAHCHYRCDCYSPMNKDVPDKMHDDNIYGRLELCDAFIVVSPIHWYSITTSVKAMFDRLVCASGTITHEEANKLWNGDVKNLDKTKSFSETKEFGKMRKNHLEGKVGAFFAHGDFGADDYIKDENVLNKKINSTNMIPAYQKSKSMPESLISEKKFISDEIFWSTPRAAVMPIVNQCRYSGIIVPDEFVDGVLEHFGISYSEANDIGMSKNAVEKLSNLIDRVVEFVIKKKKIK